MNTLVVAGFEILSVLRETSKTVSVKAVQHSLNRVVVLTFLRPELSTRPGEVARFLAVARARSQLKTDAAPNIYNVVNAAAQPYLVMELVEGTTLGDLIIKQGPMAGGQAVQIALTLADTLHSAWQQGRLVYRNLKPTEICVDARHVPKLLDFHLAAIITPESAAADDPDAGMIVGTPNYLAPEQIRGDWPLDCRTDMYAMGATLYTLVTGHAPFEHDAPETVIRRQMSDQIVHPRDLRPDLPVALCGLITRLMMKQPQDRYASWPEAMEDMQQVLKGRALRPFKTPAPGTSTIAAATSIQPPEAPRLRLQRGTISQDTPTTPHPKRHGPSFAIRIVVWTLLAVWLAALLNDRMGNPAQLPISLPHLPVESWFAGPRPASRPATPAAPTAPAQSSEPAAPIPPATTNQPAPPPEPAPVVSMPPATPAVPAAPPPAALPPETTEKLAAAFVRGDLDAACAALDGAAMSAARAAALREAIQSIPDPLRLAETTLMQSHDQELTITYMGKERRIIPRRVVNGEISADFVSPDGNRPVTFKTARFAPEELLKLLPAEPETPAAQAAVCLMQLKTGHKDEVAKRSAKCGLLAPVFEAAAQ